jgi:4'-phosphopantetheinyl transferase
VNIWQSSPANLVLSKDEVHVFSASLKQPLWRLQQLAKILSPDEQLRANNFYFEKDRWRFIVCRGILRIILGRYLDIEPSQIQFSYGVHSKPALLETSRNSSTLQFNLSHSQELALYAFTLSRQVGIDLEYIRPIDDIDSLAKHFFSEQEYTVLRKLPESERQIAFFNCWTRKEAYIKATGQGLSLPLNQFEVSLIPGDPAMLLRTFTDSKEASLWSLQELTPDPEYIAALAVQGFYWQLKMFSWSG